MTKVMIVDDEPMALSAIAHFLQTRFPSFEIVGQYRNGAQAYDAFLSCPAEIVITDIRMPVVDGLELIRKLKQQSFFFVPIIISGYSDFAYAKTAMNLGVIHYLLKPLDFTELQQCLESALFKLHQNQMLHSEFSTLQEEQELFFADLITGQIKDTGELKERFAHLNFPFSPEEGSGIYLRISLSRADSLYHYEQETLGTVVENLVRMIYRPVWVSTLFRSRNHFDLLLVRPQTDPKEAASILCEQANALMQIVLQVQLLTVFETLFQLPARNISASETNDSLSDPVMSETLPVTGTTQSASPGRQAPGSLSEAPAPDNPNPSIDSIRLAIAYIREHFGEDLTREDIAARVYMSSAHFGRLFKQETGVSFLDYLTDIRMRNALLLLNTNMKVQDIGKMVGYPSKNRFFINFRNYTSYTPTEYRRNVLKIMR